MPWVEARLRGQKVFARTNDAGALASEGGRVDIRYKLGDARSYRAAAANLEVAAGSTLLPDSTFPDGVAAPDARAGAVSASAKPRPGVTWVAYTDGACSGNPGPAGSGMIVVSPDGTLREGFEYLGESTNNVAELTAILRAVEAIPKDAQHVLVHTDSQYAIGVLTKGWKPKVNQTLIRDIKAALATVRELALVYVKGHAGIPLNERADELAREAVRSGRSKSVGTPG
ncbi:MAG: ribonuclease H [Polyangiaceae bacterium]